MIVSHIVVEKRNMIATLQKREKKRSNEQKRLHPIISSFSMIVSHIVVEKRNMIATLQKREKKRSNEQKRLHPISSSFLTPPNRRMTITKTTST